LKTLRQIYFIAWALLLSIFAILAAPKLWHNLRSGHVGSPSPTASIDNLLAPLLEIRQPSATLINVAARIPRAQRTIFISPKGDARCDFVYSALCYLTWPRKIDKVEVQPNEPIPKMDLAVYVCGLDRAMPETQSLGPHLTFHIPATSE
jgi:hypothetical protein